LVPVRLVLLGVMPVRLRKSSVLWVVHIKSRAVNCKLRHSVESLARWHSSLSRLCVLV
jgi:hypothetical protein